MPFTDAAVYWRDTASNDAITPDPVNLPPAQKIEFNDTTQVLASLEEAEQPNVSEDPGYDAGGELVIEKQFNGTFGMNVVLNIKSEPAETVFRKKLRGFYRKIPIEPAEHEFGIFGFFHPIVTDFNLDPTDRFGFTMDQPVHSFLHGGKIVNTRITLRSGGHINEIP